jgi:two-component system cell cycle sensor histidine kinase/response regulator CckA
LDRTLRSRGYRTTVSANGDQALQEIQRSDFDLLCTDAVMPGAPLSEVIAAFERKNPGANVLVCSGYVEEELTRRGIEQGKYQLLGKPFSLEQLVAAVEQSLAHRPDSPR